MYLSIIKNITFFSHFTESKNKKNGNLCILSNSRYFFSVHEKLCVESSSIFKYIHFYHFAGFFVTTGLIGASATTTTGNIITID